LFCFAVPFDVSLDKGQTTSKTYLLRDSATWETDARDNVQLKNGELVPVKISTDVIEIEWHLEHLFIVAAQWLRRAS
jgi:hypothetical protein